MACTLGNYREYSITYLSSLTYKILLKYLNENLRGENVLN
jgi:hypothetical protein